MCGIWMVLLESMEGRDVEALRKDFLAISPRGPDRHAWIQNDETGLIIGFHRLAIMDPSERGDQPFAVTEGPTTTHLICNGEIYNFKELALEYELELESNSDCEVILKLFLKLRDIDAVSKLLRGVFAFVITETNTLTGAVTVQASRDRFGVRPMFLGWNKTAEGRVEIGLFSELKSALNSFANFKAFAPGHSLTFTKSPERPGYPSWRPWFTLSEEVPRLPRLENGTTLDTTKAAVLLQIREQLTEAVVSRLVADREVGFLLSGGLDSSLVAAIAARHGGSRKIRTFCIGTKDSTDARWARAVADHIGSDHTEILFDTKEALASIPEVIWQCESYDITTIRASVGQFLVCKWISEHTDVKVLLLGDGADEVAMGYIYTQNHPSADEAHLDTLRLLREIHCYDVLRADRAVSCHGLETRVPFLDQKFVDFFLSIPVEFRIPQKGFTKAIIREAFEDTGLLPRDAIWRKKEAFSDGVSSHEDSWYEVVQRWAFAQVSDEDWASRHWTYTHNPPHSKESLYYRMEFERRFNVRGNLEHIVPKFWLPRWSGLVRDPSARTLAHYEKE